MAYNVISRRVLVEFWGVHPWAEGPLTDWYTLISRGDWSAPQDLKNVFGSVDFVADNRAIFDVGGNNYRIVVRFAYRFKTAQIKFVGTHAEYDLIDAATIGKEQEEVGQAGETYAGFRTMEIVRLIKTDVDYERAMEEIEAAFENLPEPGTPEGDRFELLSHLVARYEEGRFPIRDSDPVALLWFAIRDGGRSQAELATLIGSRSRASEILNRRRALNLDQIRAISAAWNIPVAALIPTYELVRSTA